jgi:predicted enzyme related to lactoylglutathione lyase
VIKTRPWIGIRKKLGLKKVLDERGTMPGFRWLTIAPAGHESPAFVLRKAQDQNAVGRGTTWVLEVDDCRETHKDLRARGVVFRSAPEKAPWGVSAVFEDLYGKLFNLVEPRAR